MQTSLSTLSFQHLARRYRVLRVGTLSTVLLAALLIGCNASMTSEEPTEVNPSPEITSQPDETPNNATSGETAESSDNSPEKTLISAQGMGLAQLGMTLGELKQTLGDRATFTTVPNFLVGFDAIAVSQDNAVQYHILYWGEEPLTDEDVIQGLWTDNPTLTTAQGIGAGSLISAAEGAYGTATLSYNQSNESREYVRFENHPASNLSFGTGNGNTETAGIYPTPIGEFNETMVYQEDATIQSVLLVCLEEGCTGLEEAS